MRRIFSLTVVLLLISALCIPVFAAQTASMSVSASATTLKPGDQVTFTVSVTRVEEATMGGFRFEYDKAVFEYVSGKGQSILEGFMSGVSTAAGNLAGFFMNGKDTIEGKLFSVTMQVKADAKPGTYTVTGTPSLTAGDQVTCSVNAVQVTVSDGEPTQTEQPATTEQTTQPSAVDPVKKPNNEKPIKDSDSDVASKPGKLPDKDLVQKPTKQTDEQPADGGAESNLHKTEPTRETHPVQTGSTPNQPAFPWWILIAVAVIAVGGAVFLVFEIKKTKSDEQ